MPSTRQKYLNDTGRNVPAPATTSSSTAKADHLSRQPSPPRHPQNPLHSLWQFAAVWEFLYQFHDGLKCPHYEDVEQFAQDIDSQFGTPRLHDVQIGLLKNVSSQRGLTIDQFEDYTRRQYTAKNPDANPFGDNEIPTSFSTFQPQQKVLILHQLCMWIIAKPEIFREKVDRDKAADHTDWRIDPIGWDSRGNTYYQFDNGYLYCRTEPPLPIYQKWKSRKPKGGRAAKRRRLSEMDEDENGEEEEAAMDENTTFLAHIDFKCVCSNLEEYRALVLKLEKSKHPDEKELRKVVIEDILPIFEKDEQKRQRKLLEAEKEQARLALLAGRKRSARVDERIARQREEEERQEKLQKEREEREREYEEELQRQQDEEARISKLEEREKRLQEREFRAKQRDAERARLLDPDATESEDNISSGGRKSSRQKEKRKAELETEDNDWVFDCICGTHGLNYDDGTLSIACDKCGVWQHAKCLGLPQSTAAENEFICDRCLDKEKAATSPPIKIKLRLTRPASSDGDGENGQTWPKTLLKLKDSSNGVSHPEPAHPLSISDMADKDTKITTKGDIENPFIQQENAVISRSDMEFSKTNGTSIPTDTIPAQPDTISSISGEANIATNPVITGTASHEPRDSSTSKPTTA